MERDKQHHIRILVEKCRDGGRSKRYSYHQELQSLADNGYPVYEISIRVNGNAIDRLAGSIDVTLENNAFTTSDRMRVIHLLDDGVYQMVPYTLTNGVLSFTLNTLFNVCKPNVTIAANLMKNPFFDVFENDWFYNNVMDVHQKSLMLSTSLHNFGSKLNPVRAMAVTVLYRLSNDTVSFENIFSDVASGVWYEGAVAWASANGITKGTRDGKFSPNVNITREQFATMLHNYAKYKKYDLLIGEDMNILSRRFHHLRIRLSRPSMGMRSRHHGRRRKRQAHLAKQYSCFIGF